VPLELVPVPSGKGDLPFAFNISMGVKKGDEALKARVDKVRRERSAEITAILKEYGVPLVDGGRNNPK
jgi:mxaJ protein